MEKKKKTNEWMKCLNENENIIELKKGESKDYFYFI